MNKSRKPTKPNDYLRSERQKRGWSQSRLAELIGADPTMVNRWERGHRNPDPIYQEKMCNLFNKNAVELGFIENVQEVFALSSAPASSSAHDRNIETHQTPYPLLKQTPFSLNEVIPTPPHPYFAHPYTLQENFTGRIQERDSLTGWLTGDGYQVVALVALGGMGKSALAWSWIQQDILKLPESMRPQGILWWSFYEVEAHFTTFLNHALVYTSKGAVDPYGIPSVYEKTQALIKHLQHHRFLVVLDGFEREMRSYAILTATYQEDTELEEAPDNFRACIDPHLASFLRWFAASSLESKVLLTSRLFPRELDALTSCLCKRLEPLSPDDTVSFFQAQGVRGTRSEIQSMCHPYGNHPLTLRLLTGLIMRDPAQLGDIATISKYSLFPRMVQREHHILKLTYEILKPSLQQLLSRLAAFRSKATFETVKVVSTFDNQHELKDALWELVERGLVFFDRERGTYDLHPVVRRYTYARLLQKEDIHKRFIEYLQSFVKENPIETLVDPQKKIRMCLTATSGTKSLEDISHVIELYHHIVQAKQFERAFRLYYHSLASLLYHRLGAYQIIVELLEALFAHDDVLPSTLERWQQSWILDALANAYSALGYPQRAVQLLQASIHIDRERDDKESIAVSLWNLAVQQLVLGRLSEAEHSLQESIAICLAIKDRFNEAKAHQYFSLLRAYQGLFQEAQNHLDIALSLSKESEVSALEGTILAYQALCNLLAGDIYPALAAAQRAYESGSMKNYERDIIRAKWLLGLICIRLATQEDQRDAQAMLAKAELYLAEALSRCRSIDMVDYEADLLLAWAHLDYAKGDKYQARKACTEALAITKRSAFQVLEADIYNLLARLELEDGNLESAVDYAQAALADATCDGLPYCYKIALDHSTHILEEINRRK